MLKALKAAFSRISRKRTNTPPAPEPPPIPEPELPELLYSEYAEGETLFPGLTKQITTAYGLTAVSSPAYYGSKSIRFELRDTDPMNNSGTRAEVAFPEFVGSGLEKWYGYAIMFDANDYDYDNSDEVVGQWHQGGSLTPALCFRTRRDKLYLRVMGTEWIDLGNIDKGNWHRYVLHIIHSSTSSGLIEIWRDDVKILTRAGQNMYVVGGTIKNPTFKIGVYKSAWNDSKTTDTTKRVFYLDEFRLGGADAFYVAVAPRTP